jgi:DNA (cytosine-5)-methyltransferase 1
MTAPNGRPCDQDVAAKMLGSMPPRWVCRQPATTVRTSAEVTAPTYRDRDPNWHPGKRPPSQATNAVRVTACQAALLQGFPADYPWQGTRTRQFEQVGNAVPPPLARRVLEEAIRPGGGS